MESINQLQDILFGYEINILSHHKNLVCASTISESQILMPWRLVIGYFAPNIRHISGVEKIVDDMVIRLTPEPNYKDKPSTRKVKFHSNKLFVTIREYIHDTANEC